MIQEIFVVIVQMSVRGQQAKEDQQDLKDLLGQEV